MRFRWRWWYLVVPVVLVLLIVTMFSRGDNDANRVDFGELLAASRGNQIDEIVVAGTRLKVRFRGDDTTYISRISESTDVVGALLDSGVVVGGGGPDSVAVEFEEPSAAAVWLTFLIYPGWAIALVVALYFAVKRGARIGVREGLRAVEQPEPPTSRE